MDAFNAVLAIYLIGLAVCLVVSVAILSNAHSEEHDLKRLAARAIILSPVWPLVGVYFVLTQLRELWRLAAFVPKKRERL